MSNFTPSGSRHTILGDRAIDVNEEDRLWASHPVLREHRNNVVNQIIEPLVNPVTRKVHANSLTFAIHGKWGLGKTSFLNLIVNSAQQEAKAGKVEEQLLVCHFNASAFVRTDARASLALEILKTLANQLEDDHSIAARTVYLMTKHEGHTASLDTLQQQSYSETLKELSRITRRLSRMSTFGSLIEYYLTGVGDLEPAGQPKVMLVAIDDLDRCDSEFIAGIVETIQQWSSVQNLFFIIAVDREKLNKSIHETYVARGLHITDDDVALEKYIQYRIEIPRLDEDLLEAYVKDLLSGESDTASKAMREHARLLVMALREPTPRGIKRCINTIGPRLASRLNKEQAADSAAQATKKSASQTGESTVNIDERQILKELLLEYSWPGFYQRYYERHQKRGWGLSSLLIAAAEYVGAEYTRYDDDELFEFSINRIKARLAAKDEMLSIDPALGRFLAVEPYLILTRDLQENGLIALLAGRGPQSAKATSTTGAGIPDYVDVSAEPPIRQVERLSQEARTARLAGDYQTVVNACVKAYQLYQKSPNSFTPAEVADFGNMALYAETVATQTGQPPIQDLSATLFKIGIALNPNHANNLLNYVSFLLDAEHPKMAPDSPQVQECQAILADPNHAFNSDKDKARQIGYSARLAVITGEDWHPYLYQMLEQLQYAPDRSKYSEIVSFFQNLDNNADLDLLEQATRIFVRARTIDEQDRNWGLLVYADSLKDIGDVRARLQIYAYITRPVAEGGIQNSSDIPYRGNALHNFAVVLHKEQYLAAAGECWYESYQIMGSNLARSGNLNGAYGRYLEDDGRSALAEKARKGEPLEEKVVRHSGRPTPAEYYPGGIAALGLF